MSKTESCIYGSQDWDPLNAVTELEWRLAPLFALSEATLGLESRDDAENRAELNMGALRALSFGLLCARDDVAATVRKLDLWIADHGLLLNAGETGKLTDDFLAGIISGAAARGGTSAAS